MSDLSILIPTHQRDAKYLGELCNELYAQAIKQELTLEILIHIDNGKFQLEKKVIF